MSDQRREWREVAFRFRYATEQLTVAFTDFMAAYRRAVEEELAQRAEASRRAVQKRLRDRELMEAEYQEWKRQQEERSL